MQAYLLGALLLIGLGSAVGVWQAASHYRLLLDTANSDLSKCQAARGKLESLVTEQSLQLGALVKSGRQRQAQAEEAVRRAATQAQEDFGAAHRLQQERIGGDQCAAAASVIDKELGL